MSHVSPEIAILTNARAAGQHSMIGYGELLLEAARRSGARVAEWRGVSWFDSRLDSPLDRAGGGKFGRKLDRFAVTPVRMAGRRAGVVHVADPGNAVYLGLLRKDAAVVTVHDTIPYLAAAGRLQGFRPSRAGRLLMRAIVARLRRVDRIVCVSESTRRDLLALVEPDPARVVTIPNAVFQPLAPAPDARLKRSLGLEAGARIVLHVGRNFYKNHAAVLEVFARLARTRPDLALVMVTPPTPELVGAIERHGLTGRVHLVPQVPPGGMAALYTSASLLHFPSLYEGFGYPVLEAQLCGTPVVCSNAGALAEVAGDGARVLDPDDIAGMAAAAAELLDDPQAAAALAARGRANARRFDREGWMRAHHRLYTDLGVRCDCPHSDLDQATC